MNAAAPAAPRIALVAGEASGDQLGAGLVESLRQRFPGASFAGVGGPRMQAAGLEAWHDCSELAVMGLAEVLKHLPRLLRLRRALATRLLQWRPDVFVGIDAPDFCLGLEARLKRHGIRTVHYVSPSVWAWRASRARRIGRSADCVLCLFPMEPEFYRQHGVDARFVGHPLADRMPLQPDAAAARAALSLDPAAPLLAVLPGSRQGEIERLADPFLRAAMELAEHVPGLRVVVPAANLACHAAIGEHIARLGCEDLVRMVDGHAARAMTAADVVLVASGTAALEALLAKRPMVVGYRIAPLTHALVTRLRMMKVDQYSLPNALARSVLGHAEPLVAECMQDECTPPRLVEALLPLFEQRRQTTARLMPQYQRIHEVLRQDADASAAAVVAELLLHPAGALPRVAS